MPATPDSGVLPVALPALRSGSITRPLRIAWRTASLLLHLVWGLALATVVKLDFGGRLNAERLAHHWQRRLLRILGIRLIVRGQPLAGGRVMMANHVSWLDIPLIGACTPTRFVSKSEVRDWPVAGWLADACGTFYLRRGRHGTRPLIDKLVPHLREGGSVVIFPEGTTSTGEDVLSFHSRLFAAAIESGTPVQPVAVHYGPGGAGENIAPFVGDDDLASHVLRMLRNRHLSAEVTFGAPILPAGHSREELAGQARESIRFALGLPPDRVAYPA
ncbi:MAG: lysophospholipid acyltransferase family protein [Panacagrimonas sp.]